MNIDDCIEVCEGIKAGKAIEFSQICEYGDAQWMKKDGSTLPNFNAYDYRIAPDVVYKIECKGSETHYDTHCPTYETKAKYIKGYWVEGEL